jgi:hypothetical protein
MGGDSSSYEPSLGSLSDSSNNHMQRSLYMHMSDTPSASLYVRKMQKSCQHKLRLKGRI